MLSRFDSKCSGINCPYGGVIHKGQEITWNRKMRGVAYHIGCAPGKAETSETEAGEDSEVREDEVRHETAAPQLRVSPVTSTQDSAGVFAGLAGLIAPYIEDKLRGAVDEDSVRRIVAEALKPEHKTVTVTLEVIQGDRKATVQDPHPAFDVLLKVAHIRQDTYLYGPAGSGKTTLASQVAKALGLEFRQISLTAQSFPSLLSGYMDAQGRYVGTDFRLIYELGGIFLIDEIDAASGNLLTWLNSALANGHASFPDGLIARHPDFICIATGNTLGRGASSKYSGRCVLDSATLDRFGFLEVSIDERCERAWALAMDPGAGAWVDYVQGVRARVAEHKIQHEVTPRATFRGIRAMQAGLTREQAILFAVRRGLEQDAWGKIA